MSAGLHREVPYVPRPVAVFLETTYIFLFTVGVLCSFVTSFCFLWKFFGNRVSAVPSTLSTETTSDKGTEGDKGSCEESDGSVYFEDTDEEYIRGTF